MEPDLLNDVDIVESLPKRVRFYHAKIDSTSLKSGESYRVLKNVIVIMITPYDPFGLGRMVYTISNKCEEETDMEYDDLRYIQDMVETVKKSEEVSTAYMKIFEREEYLINKAIQKEKANTQQERKRAEDAEFRASNAEARAKEMAAEILRLKEELLTRQTQI